MKKYFKYIAIFTAVLMFNCEPDDETTLSDYVGFQQGPVKLVIDQNATSNLDIKVYASDIKGSDRTYNVMVDEDASTLTSGYSVPATVTIPANSNEAVLAVSITDDENLNWFESEKSLEIKLEAFSAIKPYIIKVAEACPGVTATLSLSFDSWPEEAEWEIYNLSSGVPTVVYAGGPYADASFRESTVTEDYCLVPGDYAIVVYDEYGDGGTTYSITAGSTTYVAPTTGVSGQSVSYFTVE